MEPIVILQDLTPISEAKISKGRVSSAMSKIISYLERNLSIKFRPLGVEKFHNSAEEGYGMRYVEDGTVNCIRFNWHGSSSSEIVSVDVWNGSSRDPKYNVTFKDVSLVKALPDLVKQLKKPTMGHVKVVGELALQEAKKGEFTPETSVADMIVKLEAGRSFNRSEFVMAYHPENAFAYDEFVEQHKDKLVIQGKRISLEKGQKLSGPKAGGSMVGGGGSGELLVTKGGQGEEYEVEGQPEVERVSFSESLEHLEALTSGIIKGSFNALFVAGRGGCVSGDTLLRIRFED